MKLDRPATHEIVNKAIEDGRTAGDIAAECMEAMDKVRGQDRRRADARVLDGIPGSDATPSGDGGTDFGERLKTAVTNKLKHRNRSAILNGRN